VTEDALVVMLDDLSALQDQLAALACAHAAARQAAIPAPVRKALARLDAEYAPPLEALERRLAAQEATLKAAVLARGRSVKGTTLHAIWVKGRVSWDSRFLAIYAASHPEVQPARKEGQPSVSLRRIA
jgi:hypothetical protein